MCRGAALYLSVMSLCSTQSCLPSDALFDSTARGAEGDDREGPGDGALFRSLLRCHHREHRPGPGLPRAAQADRQAGHGATVGPHVLALLEDLSRPRNLRERGIKKKNRTFRRTQKQKRCWGWRDTEGLWPVNRPTLFSLFVEEAKVCVCVRARDAVLYEVVNWTNIFVSGSKLLFIFVNMFLFCFVFQLIILWSCVVCVCLWVSSGSTINVENIRRALWRCSEEQSVVVTEEDQVTHGTGKSICMKYQVRIQKLL